MCIFEYDEEKEMEKYKRAESLYIREEMEKELRGEFARKLEKELRGEFARKLQEELTEEFLEKYKKEIKEELAQEFTEKVRREERMEVLDNLIQQGYITIETAAEQMGMSVEEFRREKTART